MDYVFPFLRCQQRKRSLPFLGWNTSPGYFPVCRDCADGGSVITINQGVPLQGVANTTISVETKYLNIDMEALMDKLRLIDGVKRLDVLGQVD